MLSQLYRNLSRHFPVYLWLLTIWVIFGRYLVISVNLSESLPGRVFLIQKGVSPTLGDYAAFLYQGGGPYVAGSRFLKIVKGVAGSTVRSVETEAGYFDYFVDGSFAGRTKPTSKSGTSLMPGPTGAIPQHHYYMAAPHPDSLDSRYALVGWVAEEQVIGRAIEVF